MEWDSHLSLDGIILILAVLAATRWLEWRIDRHFDGFHCAVKSRKSDVSAEIKDMNSAVESD